MLEVVLDASVNEGSLPHNRILEKIK